MSKYQRKIKKLANKKATVPIKEKKEMDAIANYFLIKREKSKTEVKRRQADRNWMLCLLGFNTAFRAEDLLQLRVSELIGGYISIKENKTGKTQNFRMNSNLHEDVLKYVERNKLTPYDYMFFGQKNKNMAITRQQADSVLKEAARGIKLKSRFSMHSMRKTFGYRHYKDGGKLLTLMKMYNHSDPTVTLIYICWETDDAENDRIQIYNAGVHRKNKK